MQDIKNRIANWLNRFEVDPKECEGRTAHQDSPVPSYFQIVRQIAQRIKLAQRSRTIWNRFAITRLKIAHSAKAFQDIVRKLSPCISNQYTPVRSCRKREKAGCHFIKIAPVINKETTMATLDRTSIKQNRENKQALVSIQHIEKGFCGIKEDNSQEIEFIQKFKTAADKLSQIIEAEWECFSDEVWQKVEIISHRITSDINCVYIKNEKAVDQKTQECLSKLIKSLKKLEIVINDTLEFKRIVSEVRTLRESEEDLGQSNFARRILADAEAEIAKQQSKKSSNS